MQQLPDGRTMSEVDEDEPALRISVAPAENVLESRDPKKITANMLKVPFIFFFMYISRGDNQAMTL